MSFSAEEMTPPEGMVVPFADGMQKAPPIQFISSFG
jgi:hypothetical protein